MDKIIKGGYYTHYDDKEYRISKKQDGSYGLISHDQEDLKKGFEDITGEYDKISFFKKKITPSEVSDVYHYSTHWLYKGYWVTVKSNDDWFNDNLTEIEIITDSLELARSEGFPMFMDRDYIGTVPKSALELVETKTPAPNYFKI